MALFTDGTISSIEELNGHDTQLLTVANVEGIDVTQKLALAREELRIEVEGLLSRVNTPPTIGQVVVTPVLKIWHIYRALEMVYRDAYNSQLNDRYAGKRDEYHAMAGWAYDQLVRNGVGIAASPVEQALTPVVHPVSGALAEGTYFVTATWVNMAGEEGCPSTPAMIAVSGSSFEATTTAPPEVKGWNVYCGTSPETMTLQNEAVLNPGQAWLQPDSLNTNGRPAGIGQEPTFRLQVPRTIQRG